MQYVYMFSLQEKPIKKLDDEEEKVKEKNVEDNDIKSVWILSQSSCFYNEV